jgi:hypothetical protein
MKAELHSNGIASMNTQGPAEWVRLELRHGRERLLLWAETSNTLDREGANLRIRRHERDQVKPTLRLNETMRVHHVVLVTTARPRVIPHLEHPVVQTRFEQH